MKRLYLIRHAKSSKDIPGIKDKDRPLDKRGKREAGHMGRRLRKCGIVVQAIYSSPAKRALDTAIAIAKRIGYPCERIKTVNSMYKSDIPMLMKVVRSIDDQVESSVIFGHNPEFFSLVNYLTPRIIRRFSTCGVFGIDFTIDSWKKVARKKGKLIFYQSPSEGYFNNHKLGKS